MLYVVLIFLLDVIYHLNRESRYKIDEFFLLKTGCNFDFWVLKFFRRIIKNRVLTMSEFLYPPITQMMIKKIRINKVHRCMNGVQMGSRLRL
jgi:hypothetical protein